MEKRIVYQVLNLTREEMFFGTMGATEGKLDDEILRLAKDPKGPAAAWQKGEIVQWRSLTPPLDEGQAQALHRELEGRRTPKFACIPTYKG